MAFIGLQTGYRQSFLLLVVEDDTASIVDPYQDSTAREVSVENEEELQEIWYKLNISK